MGFLLFFVMFVVTVLSITSSLFGLIKALEFVDDYKYLDKSEYLERLKEEKAEMLNTWGGRLLIPKYLGFLIGEFLNRRIK